MTATQFVERLPQENKDTLLIALLDAAFNHGDEGFDADLDFSADVNAGSLAAAFADLISDEEDWINENTCECGEPINDGEGWDGKCGNCADREARAKGEVQ